MSLDSFVTLGHSGLRVSPLCLGTMTFGEDHGWGASAAVSETILAEYFDRGGNFIDTANLYTNGHSEKIIGDFLANSAIRRDQAVLSTKFFCNLFDGDPNGGGAGRKALMQQVEASLRRLRSEYIDLYWLHSWDRTTPIEETLRGLDDLVTAGKIRYIGISDLPAWKISQAQVISHFKGWSPIIAVQLEYSLLARTVEAELLPMAQELGIGVMPWSPLKNGLLSGKFRRDNVGSVVSPRSTLTGLPSEADFVVIDALCEVAEDVGASPAAVALAWVRSRSGVTSTIIGARRHDQLIDNLGALEVKLSADQIVKLDEVSQPASVFPAQYMRPKRSSDRLAAMERSSPGIASPWVTGIQTPGRMVRWV